MLIKIALSILIVILMPLPVMATSRTCDSCAYVDVKAKYDLSEAGDTIIIPACNDGATWTTGLAVTIPISIIGNGSTGDSKTKIIADGSLTTGIISINLTTTSLVRVSGIYFDTVTTDNTSRIGVKINGSITQLQIDNNYFNAGKYQIYKAGKVFGVIYENTFRNAMTSMELDGDNDTSWGETITAGTDTGLNTLYIEDNTFLRDSSLPCGSVQNHIETSQGRGFVLRYNTFDGSTFCYDECVLLTGDCYTDYTIMTHGNGACYESSVLRGLPLIEIYNNTITGSRLSNLTLRGGSFLIHDNTFVSAKGTPYVDLREEESEGGAPFVACAKTAWPAEDQVFNSFIWDNTVNTAAMTITTRPANSSCTASETPYKCCTGSGTGTCDTFMVEDQDYFTHAPAASGGKETLYNDGTTSFTYNASGQMTFSGEGANAYFPYTPYTYPHPLTDQVLPTITSFTVDPSGAFVTIHGSENLAVTTGAGYTLSSDGDAVTLTHTSISGTDIIQATSRTILSTETLTYSYTGTDTKDLSGNELAAITDAAVTNSSTQSGAVTSQTVYGVTGSTVFSGAGSTIYQ